MLPPEMLPTTTEDSTTVDQSKSVKNIDKVKKKRTIAVEYYKSVIDASEDRVTMPKQLQEQLKMESEKFKCLKKDKILDKSTMNESDQQIFDTINIYVFEIMKKKITTIKKTT
uniref:Uncharacterized protein n=1 Tax=Romanomermis culicivorax TaxID=13658 RepID=A0A915JNS7_ROMCU